MKYHIEISSAPSACVILLGVTYQYLCVSARRQPREALIDDMIYQALHAADKRLHFIRLAHLHSKLLPEPGYTAQLTAVLDHDGKSHMKIHREEWCSCLWQERAVVVQCLEYLEAQLK